MKFEVLGKPQGKQRARVTMRGGYARAYTPEETASYENLIKLSYKAAVAETKNLIDLWNKPIFMTVMAYYDIPKSFSRKKVNEALLGNLRPQTKPDIDNVIKVVCDALNGVAYKDDTQIIKILAYKCYSSIPKIIIELEEL